MAATAPGPLGIARPRLVGALVIFAWLAFAIGLHPLMLPEEGRYVGVAWEMLRSGDWIVPTQNGLPFFHKPPLFYWLTALSMELFGPNAAAARLASLLGACLAAFGFHAVTRRRAGAAIADASVVVLATLPFFFAAAQFANLDMLVAAFIALAIVFAADAALALRDGQPHRTSLVLAWACAALGVLAKGLIGLVLPGLVIVVWLIVSGQARTILRLVAPLGLLIFALIAAPWFVAVQQQHAGFARYFFVYQHFERFTASGFNNPQPWWFFLAVLPLLALPWSFWLVRVRFRAAADDSPDQRAWRRLMWTWLVTVVVFFSLPESKPIGYVMPAIFPLAYLIAEPVLAAWRSERRGWRRLAIASLAGAVAIGVGAVAWLATRYDRDNTALAHALLRLRAPGDPVVFVDEYFFDVPLHARLTDPVAVIADWHDPKIAERDNWRRELAEAAPFAPARSAALLVDAAHGYALRCGTAPLWAVVKLDDEARVAAQADATRVFAANRAALWRLAPQRCAAPAPSPSPTPAPTAVPAS
ncbi:MAG TPA: glycosyltransferase family 39 protein [Caldimonas sp.]|nr:glycosyltransferase family 39 protein [Caldimonas sp.]